MTVSLPARLKGLFVCYGNICRSPMAVGIAGKIMDNHVYAESAGMYPTGLKASQEAAEVMQERGIDISAHRPRGLTDIRTPVSEFEYIIALDSYVFNRLKAVFWVPSGKLIEWDVEDPIGQGMEAFRQSASAIENKIKEFFAEIGLI